jgi:3-oxoacyl-[acyl-carrier protein] reductase
MNILVTGVSKGLGLSITESILQKGWNVYGISRSMSNELQKLSDAYPGHLFWISYDLSDTDNVKNDIFKDWIGFETEMHGFVNNAALAYDDIITNLNIASLTDMYKVNVFTPMNITKYIIRQFLLHQIKGSIVHLSSISVHTGYKGLSMYASTKGALEAFSKNTAREWGEVGIRSNSLIAGFMETEMSSTLTTDQKNRIYQRTSLKKAVEKTSVAETIVFLLSEQSQSITGQNIHVDAGTI